MSSTNRGATRLAFDYYATDPDLIESFLREWAVDHTPQLEGGYILDPCAGGNIAETQWVYKEASGDKAAEVITVPPTPMAYPLALNRVYPNVPVVTNDVRADSPAQYHVDFLESQWSQPPAMVITNPPFFIALRVIQKALGLVREGGYVAMLLRLNFKGTQTRAEWFRACPPVWEYTHADRPSFLPNGKKDSIEYAHMVWVRGATPRFTQSRVI